MIYLSVHIYIGPMSLFMKKVLELVSIRPILLSMYIDFLFLYVAAALVVRVILSGSAPVTIHFRCDKPFLYAVRYKQTILFIGRYVKVIDTSNMPPIIDGGYGRGSFI